MRMRARKCLTGNSPTIFSFQTRFERKQGNDMEVEILRTKH